MNDKDSSLEDIKWCVFRKQHFISACAYARVNYQKTSGKLQSKEVFTI